MLFLRKTEFYSEALLDKSVGYVTVDWNPFQMMPCIILIKCKNVSSAYWETFWHSKAKPVEGREPPSLRYTNMSVASCQVIFVSCELRVVSWFLSVESCELRAEHCSAGVPSQGKVNGLIRFSFRASHLLFSSDAWYDIHFHGIREGGGLAPPHRSFKNQWCNIGILYIILKAILWRFRFNLIFLKTFWFHDFMSNFR